MTPRRSSARPPPPERHDRARRRPLEPLFAALESYYGVQAPDWPTDTYRFLIWWQCGYPPSRERCARGWQALNASVGSAPGEILAARPAQLARALAAGGLVPELRVTRVRDIARRVQAELGTDPDAALARLSEAECRKVLKRFPGIGTPGADRILLFGGLAPVAAVPSNCPHVPVRIASPRDSGSYAQIYARAQQLLEAEVPPTYAARRRAWLLLQRHGGELCKSKNPRCAECPICGDCAWRARRTRGRTRID